MYQCILNVPLWNDWSKVTYSQVHGSSVLKLFHSKSWSGFLRQHLQSSYSLGKIQNLVGPEYSGFKNKNYVSMKYFDVLSFTVFSTGFINRLKNVFTKVFIYKFLNKNDKTWQHMGIKTRSSQYIHPWNTHIG